MAKEYVRLTYLPHGDQARRKTVWAVVLRRASSRITYLECDKEGDTEREVKPGVVQKRMIIAAPQDVSERPAKMNLKYAELEVVS